MASKPEGKDIDFEKVMSLLQASQAANNSQVVSGSNQQQMAQAQNQANNAVAGGVTQGAVIGQQFGGAQGAAIGAGVGAVSGLLSRSSKKKQAKQAKDRALADIEKEKQDQTSNIIGGIIQNLRGIL